MAGNKSSRLKLLLGGVDIVICWWREDRSLPPIRGNDCSARHWQITIFWEPSSMIVMLVLVCNLVGKCGAGRHLVSSKTVSKPGIGRALSAMRMSGQLSEAVISSDLERYHLYRKLENFGENSNWTFHLAGNFSDKGYTFWGIGFSCFYRNDRNFLYLCVNYQFWECDASSREKVENGIL